VRRIEGPAAIGFAAWMLALGATFAASHAD
jgi:hypothetical protein